MGKMYEQLMKRVKERMDVLQSMMESQKHLTEDVEVINQISSVMPYWSHMSDEDKDYIHACQYAIEEKTSWNV